jgi:hypothetical protein
MTHFCTNFCVSFQIVQMFVFFELLSNGKLTKCKKAYIRSKVSDPDPHSNADPDREGQKLHTKI